jgi:hypothetical protein
MLRQKLSSKRNDALCIVAILALATLFLLPALRSGYTLLPLGLESGIAPWHKQVTQQSKNLLLSDPFYTFYPRRYFFTTSLQRGTYPLWNPYIFSGHPVLGDTAAQTFYPPNLFAARFLSAARSLPILAWFHLTLTGLAMFAFLRLLRLGPGPSLFGAVAWMLNGDAIVWLENPHRLSTLAWMPAIFLFFELALRRRQTWPGVVAGLLYGFSILGGHTQFAIVLGLSLASYAIMRTYTLTRTARKLAWQPLALAAGVGLVGVGLGAIQLLPTLQLAQLSHRTGLNVDQFLGSRWPHKHVIGLWVPDFYGNPVQFSYWGEANYAEVTAYFGALSFPLALSSLLWVRSATRRFFVIVFLLLVFIAWGTPLVWLVAWVPGFRFFRLMSLTAFLPFFGGAAAAFGLEKGLVRFAHRDRLAMITLLFLLVGLIIISALIIKTNGSDFVQRQADIRPHLWRTGLIWTIGISLLLLTRWKSGLATALLITLLAVDLFQWGQPFNPVNSLEILYPKNDVSAWLRQKASQDTSLYRILPLQTDRVVFGPNVLSVFDFYEVGGYSSLMVERYRELVKSIDDEVAIWWMRPNYNMLVVSNFKPLFSLLNVKYILTSHQLDQPLFLVEASYPGCVGPPVPLKSNTRVTQSFRALYPGLNRVDVELVRLGDTSGQSIRFLLWRDKEDGELVADLSIDAANLPDHGNPAFFFAPVSDSAGQTFVWAIESPEAGETATIAVCRAEAEPTQRLAFAAFSAQLAHTDIQQGVWIYENPNVLPRAFVVHRAEITTAAELLDRLNAQDFNPWTTILLESPLPNEQAIQLANAPLRSDSVAHITRYDLHEVEITAEMKAPGILVLSDQWYPGWQVTVDGVDAPLLRTNYALRGVFVPDGTHQVTFRFRPLPLYLGLALAVITLMLGAGAIGWDVYRKSSDYALGQRS